jgi:hypothetical protein
MVGLLASITCHLMGWLDIELPQGTSLSLLHAVMFISIFSLVIPLIILAERTKPKTGRGNLDHLFALLPKWARIAAVVLLVYAVLNYVVIMISHHPWPGWRRLPVAVQLRGFSGHWMLFYAWALAGFVALRRMAQKKRGNHGVA